MIKEVKLRTAGMFGNHDPTDNDYVLWKSIAEYMDGETALVIKSSVLGGKYVFLGLENEEKNKKLFYKMEQDSVMGTYINDYKGFETVWENGEYDPAGCMYLEPQYLEY